MKRGKIKNKSKVYPNRQLILILLLIIGVLMCSIILINKKENIKEYGGIIFNKEMNLDIINLIQSRDESPVEVPVPKGYVASSVESERAVNGGFVIYEGEEEVTEENLEEAKRTRNQYVWIPIEDASDMYHISENKIYGAYYEFTSTGYTRKTRSNEPIIVSEYDKETTNLVTYLDGISQNQFLKEMEQNFYEMIESVATYGGFYIGRYETGNLSQNVPVVVKMNTDITKQNWYNMYKRCKKISKENDNVLTHMIWGIQFDETLKWLIDTGCKTHAEVATNSTSWGNYQNATFKYTNTSGGTSTKPINSRDARIPTGSTEYTKANNIYDLAGNVYDWTMEGIGSSYRCLRGGYYDSSGGARPAYDRNNATRPTLGSNLNVRFTYSTLYKVILIKNMEKICINS